MRNRLLSGVLVLLGVSLGLFPWFGWIGYRFAGQLGVVAAVVSWLICFIPAVIALVVVISTAGGQYALAGGLVGTLVRPFVALSACLVIGQIFPGLVQARVIEMILVWYLILLLVETVAAVRIVTPKKASAEVK